MSVYVCNTDVRTKSYLVHSGNSFRLLVYLSLLNANTLFHTFFIQLQPYIFLCLSKSFQNFNFRLLFYIYI